MLPLLLLALPAAAQLRAPALKPVLAAPALVAPLVPRLGAPLSPALVSPVLPGAAAPVLSPSVLAAPAVPVAVNAVAPKASEAALPRDSARSAAHAVEDVRPLARAAKAAARTARAAAPALKAEAAASLSFFDGAASFPDLVEPAGVKGFVRELREPARRLRAMGVKGTVTAYGSARIPSREKAQAAYDAAVAAHGRRPRSAAGKKALSEARAALRASRWYEEARRFGRLVAERSGGGLAVVTGGGPGIMEAANRGAFEAGGRSVGYNIVLEHEQSANPYVTPGLEFEFQNFTTRKMNLRHGAMALTYWPGGFGTMDELFEVLTLMQTGKMARVPIVLVGERSYWQKVIRFREFAHMGLISEKDLELFVFAESAEDAWSAIEKAYSK